jgi:hypothetical protein
MRNGYVPQMVVTVFASSSTLISGHWGVRWDSEGENMLNRLAMRASAGVLTWILLTLFSANLPLVLCTSSSQALIAHR